MFYAGLCAGVGGIRAPVPIRSEKIGVNLASDSQNRGAIAFPYGHWRFFACSRNGRMNFFELLGLICVHANTYVRGCGAVSRWCGSHLWTKCSLC
ncbi:MAG TPA: hypothetical protein DIT89_12135 [Planctomycetaceae bacterium]|nr:hypothetical protein [Planctomycetaceae bacterium]